MAAILMRAQAGSTVIMWQSSCLIYIATYTVYHFCVSVSFAQPYGSITSSIKMAL